MTPQDPVAARLAQLGLQSDPVAERLRELEGARERPRGYKTPEEIAALNERDLKESMTWGGPLEKFGAGAQAFSDAATFGLSGLVDDALTAATTKGTFKDIRGARRQARESLPVGVQLGAELAGALATPIPGAGAFRAVKSGVQAVRAGRAVLPEARAVANTLSPANTLLPQVGKGLGLGKTADRALRFGSHVAETAAQAGLEGGVRNLDDLSMDGLRRAGERGLQSGAMGAAIGIPLGTAAGWTVRGVRKLGEKPEDKALSYLQKLAESRGRGDRGAGLQAIRADVSAARAAGGQPIMAEGVGESGIRGLTATAEAPLSDAGEQIRRVLGERGATVLPRADQSVLGMVGAEGMSGIRGPEYLMDWIQAIRQDATAPLYLKAAAEAAAKEGAAGKASAHLAELLKRADVKALPAPGQSSVALTAAHKRLAELEDEIARYSRAGQGGEQGLAEAVANRNALRDAIANFPQPSVSTAPQAPWWSSRPVPPRNEGRVGPMYQGRERRFPGRGRRDSQYENVPDLQEAARAPGWETPAQSSARQALEQPRGGGQLEGVVQGDLPVAPRQIRLQAANDINVRNPEYVPAPPGARPPTTALDEVAGIIENNSEVQSILNMLRSNPEMAGVVENPTSYEGLMAIHRAVNDRLRDLTGGTARSRVQEQALEAIKPKILAAASEIAPSARTATTSFAKLSEPADAFQIGMEFDKLTPETLDKMIQTGRAPDGSAVDVESLRLGAVQKLRDILVRRAGSQSLSGAAKSKDVLAGLNTEGLDRRIRAVLGDEYDAIVPKIRQLLSEEGTRLSATGMKERVVPDGANVADMFSAFSGGLGFGLQAAARRTAASAAKGTLRDRITAGVGRGAEARADMLLSSGNALEDWLRRARRERFDYENAGRNALARLVGLKTGGQP